MGDHAGKDHLVPEPQVLGLGFELLANRPIADDHQADAVLGTNCLCPVVQQHIDAFLLPKPPDEAGHHPPIVEAVFLPHSGDGGGIDVFDHKAVQFHRVGDDIHRFGDAHLFEIDAPFFRGAGECLGIAGEVAGILPG